MTGTAEIRTVVVTGAAGFIGSHLCEALLRVGRRVIGFDNFDTFYDPAVKRANLAESLKHEAFMLIEGDIRDSGAVDRLLRPAGANSGVGGGAKRIDAVVHLAARAGVRPSIENPLLYQDVNIRGTAVLLEAIRAHGVSRFIFGSSSSVYGNNKKVPFSEVDNVDHPISPYAATKRAGELLCHTYHHLFGTSVTCLRFFTVYGARQRPDLAIHKFARIIDAGKPIPFFGDGSMKRDHTYIDDIVAGVLAAIDRCDGYHVYNLGGSRPVSLSDLVAALENALGKKAMLDRLPRQPGDMDQTYADVSRALADLGYTPQVPLEEGLRRFVAWFRHGLR